MISSEKKDYINTLKDAFEAKDIDTLINNLSPSFYDYHEVEEKEIRSYLERFFEDYDFPEAAIRFRQINNIEPDQYAINLLLRIIAVPKKGIIAGAYGDRRITVFGSPARGRGVQIVISRTYDGFLIDRFDAGEEIAEEVR